MATTLYDYQGNALDLGGEGGGAPINYDVNVKGIAHRGYSTDAPENTIPAFKLAKENGFNYVESDVRFTSDGVAVMLHNASINNTSNGTGNIADMTLAQARTYDFGSWKSPEYAGTKIPTFEEFLLFCKRAMLHPYIELKVGTQAQIEGLVDMVEAAGMKGKVTWISFNSTLLGYVKDYDEYARLGLLVSNDYANNIAVAKSLRTGKNEVFYDCDTTNSTFITACKAEHMPMEFWTTDEETAMRNLNRYFTGVTSNCKIFGKVLYDNAMGIS